MKASMAVKEVPLTLKDGNQISIWLSQDARVGVKWKWTLGCVFSPRSFFFVRAEIVEDHSKRRCRVEFLGFMNSLVAAFPDRELHVIARQ
jgi:hypothetical protein